MNLAMVGPLPPSPTGIADYSLVLLRHLRPHFERLLAVVDRDAQPTLAPHDVDGVYQVPDTTWWSRGPAVPLYQMGNHAAYHGFVFGLLRRFPGITVLHDGNLLPFFHAITLDAGSRVDYVREVGFNETRGEGRHLAWQLLRGAESLDPHRFTMLARVVRASLGIVVHNATMRDRVLEVDPQAHVTIIPHLDVAPLAESTLTRAQCRALLGYDQDEFVIGSLGFIAPTKRIEAVLEAVSELISRYPHVRLACVGEAVADYDVQAAVRRLGLEGHVRFTGYVTGEELDAYTRAVDVGVNLRYPTWGESSGTLIRLMSAGKPVLVTDAGSFAELPGGSVVKIPAGPSEGEMLVRHLSRLIADDELRSTIGHAARAYIEAHCSPAVVARRYASFIRTTVSRFVAQ
jgi:glycosyltransferase involved in cell wall biosynthesis